MQFSKFVAGVALIYVGTVLASSQVIIPGYEKFSGIIGLGIIFLGFVVGMSEFFRERA